MPGVRLDQQQRVVTFTQSWLADFMRCPERAWYDWRLPKRESNDATATGQGLHHFMASRLEGMDFGESSDRAVDLLHSLVESDGFRFIKVKTVDTMLKHLAACIRGFERHVVPQVPDGGYVERTLLHELAQVDDFLIMLEGTPDYVDRFGRVWDWKSAATEYNAFETALWAIQPTTYTYLATMEAGEDRTEFTYAVVVKPHGHVQFIDVERDERDWEWLARIAGGAFNLMRSLPDGGWPVNHTHHLCSPRWCPAWEPCRGAYLEPVPVTFHTDNGADHE